MAGGRCIEYQRMPAKKKDRPTLVFLHEGLGCVAQWRDFPRRVAEATGCAALIYSRYGHGQSDVCDAPRGVRFMHDEALLALPELLTQLEIHNPLLIGHSDGASIALIYAGAGVGSVTGLIAMAPHVFVEDISITGIEKARVAWRTTDLPHKLARYHRDAAKTFAAWNDAWLNPDFRHWNIEEYLPRIASPILAIQGEEDEYGSMAQVDAIAAQAPNVQLLKLIECGHAPHKDQPEATLNAVARFILAGEREPLKNPEPYPRG